MLELGRFALLLALFLSGYAALVDILSAWRKDAGLIKSAQNATAATLACLSVAVVALCTLLVRSDFSVSYVAEHTSRALPLEYKVSALWAGGAGSLLLWLWIQAGFVVIVFCKCRREQWPFTGTARTVANGVSVFFLLVLILDKNPFAMSVVVPPDGAGLNPLLQHLAMVLHPPALFVGYAALIIPFAWAFAVMKSGSGRGKYPLFAQARNWALVGWLFLTIGIALGAWWAYEELGWGGYWAWDPVENSSLMPWLTATALLHCFRRYKPGTAVSLWLTVLSLITFSLCIFGTFLTRYGLVSSVHAFPEPGLGALFLVLLAHIWVAAAVLLWRKHRMERGILSAEMPRGGKFISYNGWLMMILTFVIFTGTLFPFFSGLVTDQKITLKPEYFTKITAPLGLALLLLLSVCPHLLSHGFRRDWRGVSGMLVALAAMVAWLVSGKLAPAGFIICGYAMLNLAIELLGPRVAAARRKKTNSGHARNLHWYGAKVAHIGVVLMFIGIAGSGGYSTEKEAPLRVGERMTVGSFDVEFCGLTSARGRNFTATTANIAVFKDDELIVRLHPSQALYMGSQKRTSEVDIRRTLGGDLYTALTGVDRNGELINLNVLIKPLINWIWIGGVVAVLGAVLVLISYYRRRRV